MYASEPIQEVQLDKKRSEVSFQMYAHVVKKGGSNVVVIKKRNFLNPSKFLRLTTN